MVKEGEGANPGRYVLAPAWHWAAEVKLFHFLLELLHTERPPLRRLCGGYMGAVGRR